MIQRMATFSIQRFSPQYFVYTFCIDVSWLSAP